MSEIERFDTWRQRCALTDLAEDKARFFSTAEGAAFMEQLEVFFAPALVARAHSWGYGIDSLDVVHMMVERLLTTAQESPEKAPVRFAAAADEPWAYLWTCALRWARESWGVRGDGQDRLDVLADAPALSDDHDLTPLHEVVRLTHETLASRVADQHHAELLDLLGWLAANPLQRLSYESVERRAAHRFCPSFTIEQVTAVMNIAWGGRPRQAETSLMGQFLIDPQFDPALSPSHMRALIYFKNAFRAAEHGSRLLTDWTAS